MALCSKCGKEVPFSAWSCPNCGEPISHNENSAPATREDSTSPIMAKKQQISFGKIPRPIKILLYNFQQNSIIQTTLKKANRLPKIVKIIGIAFCLAAVLAGATHTFFSDELTLKKQANAFIEARNRILIGVVDTDAMETIAKNIIPEYKKKYLDGLLYTGSKTFTKESVFSKSAKITAELQSIQIEDDNQHALVNYKIYVPTNQPLSESNDQQQLSLKDAIVQLSWVKIDGKWYFCGEKTSE